MSERAQGDLSVREIRTTAEGLEARRSGGELPSENEIRCLLDAVRARIDDPTVTVATDLMTLLSLLQLWSARLTLYYNVHYDRALKRTPEELAALTRDWKALQSMAASPGYLMASGHPETDPKRPTVDGTAGLPDSYGAAMFGPWGADDKDKGEE